MTALVFAEGMPCSTNVESVTDQGRFMIADVRTSPREIVIVTAINWTNVVCVEAMGHPAWDAPMTALATSTTMPHSTMVPACFWIAMEYAVAHRLKMTAGFAMGPVQSFNAVVRTFLLANVTATETWWTSSACAEGLA